MQSTRAHYFPLKKIHEEMVWGRSYFVVHTIVVHKVFKVVVANFKMRKKTRREKTRYDKIRCSLHLLCQRTVQVHRDVMPLHTRRCIKPFFYVYPSLPDHYAHTYTHTHTVDVNIFNESISFRLDSFSGPHLWNVCYVLMVR